MDWQPIESAPTDGQRLMLSEGRVVEPGFWNGRFWQGYDGGKDLSWCDGYAEPRFWAYWPQPPE